tara:strand:- start:3384 stop:3578 length:195 start_codon:yes stop_codon:yes gene_type:complete
MKTYEKKVQEYKSKMANMARLETVTVKFQIASENADAAAHFAKRAARWVFTAYPELREDAQEVA